MKEIELKRKRFAFKIDGNVYELKSPTVSMVKDYTKKQKELEKAGEEDAIEGAIDFLARLGMPKEVAEELELEHLETVIEQVTGAKKK